MLGVEPDGLGIERIFLGEIDHGVGAVDAFERESVDQFLARHALAVVLGRPAEQAEKIDEGVGQEAGVAIGGDADHRAVLALGELGAIGRHQQRQVGERGRGDAEGFEDQDVLEGVGDVVLPAHDVADAQVGVVGAGAQVIGGHAVAAQQGEILDIGGGFGLRAVDGIGEFDVADGFARHAEAQREGLSGGGAAVAFGAGQLAHFGMEEPGLTLARRALRARRREIAIRQALRENRLGGLAVQGEALGLLVLLVPAEIEPAQAVENGIERGFGVALHVGIVDAQDHSAAVAAGEEPIENEGARAPDVQKARGRGREPDSEHGNFIVAMLSQPTARVRIGAEAGGMGAVS